MAINHFLLVIRVEQDMKLIVLKTHSIYLTQMHGILTKKEILIILNNN